MWFQEPGLIACESPVLVNTGPVLEKHTEKRQK